MSRLNVDKITGATGTSSGAPITLSGDTATLGSGVAMAANHAGVKTALNASGSASIYACRSWVNFNGTGTVAIRDSGNVSSITDNASGDYTVNLTTAMPDSNFCALGTGSQKQNLSGVRNLQVQAPLTTSTVRVLTDPITGLYDLEDIFVAVIR